MKKSTVEIWVGLFVLLGLICISYLTIKLGKAEIVGDNHYVLNARFNSVTGLKPGALVEIAGVEIGKVDAIMLDQERMAAHVRMKIRKDVRLNDDTIASIKTSGIIGDKYIRIEPGGSDIPLENDETITDTESAIDLEAMISKYVFGGVE